MSHFLYPLSLVLLPWSISSGIWSAIPQCLSLIFCKLIQKTIHLKGSVLFFMCKLCHYWRQLDQVQKDFFCHHSSLVGLKKLKTILFTSIDKVLPCCFVPTILDSGPLPWLLHKHLDKVWVHGCHPPPTLPSNTHFSSSASCPRYFISQCTSLITGDFFWMNTNTLIWLQYLIIAFSMNSAFFELSNSGYHMNILRILLTSFAMISPFSAASTAPPLLVRVAWEVLFCPFAPNSTLGWEGVSWTCVCVE